MKLIWKGLKTLTTVLVLITLITTFLNSRPSEENEPQESLETFARYKPYNELINKYNKTYPDDQITNDMVEDFSNGVLHVEVVMEDVDWILTELDGDKSFIFEGRKEKTKENFEKFLLQTAKIMPVIHPSVTQEELDEFVSSVLKEQEKNGWENFHYSTDIGVYHASVRCPSQPSQKSSLRNDSSYISFEISFYIPRYF